MNNLNHIVTRIAPSPTGTFHLGTARTALFNYLFAKKHNGTFIVRFEDTDKKRSEKKYEKDILASMQWMGMDPDIIERQSERTHIYQTYIANMLEAGTAYRSKEPAKDNPEEEIEIIRFKNTHTDITFTDSIRGEITTDISNLGNFVIARNDSEPLYHLAVVIDDQEMGVTHIIRGDDHISNTARQIALIRAIQGTIPAYTHIPLLHSTDGGKLSKRKHAVSIQAYKEEGYLSEAMINYLALLGWSPKNDAEIFSPQELTTAFDLEGIQKQKAIFDEKKLRWFNKQYIKQMSDTQWQKLVSSFLTKRFPLRMRFTTQRTIITTFITSDSKERFDTIQETGKAIAQGEYDYLFRKPLIKKELLLRSDGDISTAQKHMQYVSQRLLLLPQWNEDAIQQAVWDYATEQGRASVLWPMRVLLSGLEKSPSPFTIAATIGKKETIRRLSSVQRIT